MKQHEELYTDSQWISVGVRPLAVTSKLRSLKGA